MFKVRDYQIIAVDNRSRATTRHAVPVINRGVDKVFTEKLLRRSAWYSVLRNLQDKRQKMTHKNSSTVILGWRDCISWTTKII